MLRRLVDKIRGLGRLQIQRKYDSQVPLCCPLSARTTQVHYCKGAVGERMDLVEKAKEAAAQRAVDNHIKNNFVVGIGSGSTVVYAVEHLARRIKENNWKISCVPTSFQAKELIRKYNLVMTDLEESPDLDVAIDGADEVDAKLTLIKGGGGCLTQEKVIASCAKHFIVVADYR
ncbi:unnamed protein product, partial [Ixodes persulcatus]